MLTPLEYANILYSLLTSTWQVATSWVLSKEWILKMCLQGLNLSKQVQRYLCIQGWNFEAHVNLLHSLSFLVTVWKPVLFCDLTFHFIPGNTTSIFFSSLGIASPLWYLSMYFWSVILLRRITDPCLAVVGKNRQGTV